MSDPITREETYLAALSGEAVNLPEPITRNEMYLAYLCGMDVNLPAPITRKDYFMYTLCQQGVGGGGVAINNQDKTITENGEYTADEGYTGLGTVTVNVEAASGADDVARAIVERTIAEYSDNEVTAVGPYAFSDCIALISVNIPSAQTLGQYAFNNCAALANANIPKITVLPDYAFYKCNSLNGISWPQITAIGKYTFGETKGLYNIQLPSITVIPNSAFRGNVMVTVDGSMFPAVTTIQDGAFYGASLQYLDLPLLTRLEGWTFRHSPLKVIVLRSDIVCTLVSLNTFGGVSNFEENGTGKGIVLVPSALVTAYTEATNWSVVYARGIRFRAVEDYTVDGTITGEIDWDKVNALFEEDST